MEFKGTKGKWELAKYKTKVFCKPKHHWMPIQGIAIVQEVPMDREERTANALLISKAPEMLEMLQKIVLMTNTCTGTFQDFKERYNIEIEKLIHEATNI